MRVAELDGFQYLSIRDIVMCVCDKDSNHAAQIWRRLPEERKTEVGPYCVSHKFPGPGQSEQPVITFSGALKLVMFLPGENAKKYRSIMARILQRYYAGDESLIDEVEANTTSASVASKLARNAQHTALDAMDTVGGDSGGALKTLMMVDAKVDRTNEELYKLNAELHFCRNKMEKQTAVVVHLNTTIRAKDAELRCNTDAANRHEDTSGARGIVIRQA